MKKILTMLSVASVPISLCQAYQMGVRDERDRDHSTAAALISKAYDTGVEYERRRVVSLIKEIRDQHSKE